MANLKVIEVPLSEIVVDEKWNARGGDWKKDKNDETSWEGFVASIDAQGVKEPVKCRPTGKTKQPYELIYGFRRYAASVEAKKTTIPVIVEELTDSQARLENLRENTSRENLRGVDLAWGIADLAKADPKLGDTNIAKMLGLSQPYVGKLHTIMTELPKKITDQWRNGAVYITVKDMYRLATQVPKERREEEFEKIVKGNAVAGGKKAGKGAWIKNLKKKAYDLGQLLGTLKREAIINKIDDKTDMDVVRDAVMTIPSKAKAPQLRGISESILNGFKAGMVQPTVNEDEDEDGDEDGDED